MRLAVVADTHMPKGRRELPARCLRELEAADLIVHLGDFATAAVLDRFEALGPLAAVRGNVDDDEVRARLPETVEVELEGVRLALIHDGGPRAGRLRRLRARFPGADAVLFGHSHLPLHEQEAGFRIFNPGSPTERRRAPSRTMGIGAVEDGRLRLRHVELGP